MSTYLCPLRAFGKKRKDDMTPENKERIADKMDLLAKDWKAGEYKNVKDAGWNNFETFEWLWDKYTHKPLDFGEFPANFKDVRKFEFGLQYYDKLIAKPQGFFASKFHLPRAAMQNIPELKRFETELINETSFFRDYSIETGKQVNEILDNFKKFSLSMGDKFQTVRSIGSAGQRRLSEVQRRYDVLTRRMLSTTDPRQQDKISEELRENRNEIKSFYESGSGEAFKMINSVLQGADIESIPNLDNLQRTQLNKIKDNYVQIRKSGVTGLIRGLQKIKSMAKDKDLRWVDGTVKRINSLIKAIEFQHVVDENGKVIDYKYLQNERDFLELGFDSKNTADRYARKGKVSFSKNYMSQYTLGILKTIKKLENAVDNRELSITEEIKNELDSWDSIVNVAKKRNPIVNPVYDNDPYFFIKKYASDVGIFNYKAHVKSTFKKATDAIQMEHLEPAKEAGRKDLQESSESMLKVLTDVYNEIQHVDPSREGHFTDMMRVMTSVTYFRLMGGNIRSAVRNGTQRMYEWVEYGAKASLIDSKKFYNESGLASVNQAKLNKQLKNYGLQWFDGKSRTSNAWESLTGKTKISEGTRGALEDAYMMDKELFVTADGELTIKGGSRYTEKLARGTGNIARAAGGLHRIVEDWNRGKTFKVAFALASQNLASTNKSWLTRKILGKEGIDKIRERKGKDHSVGYEDLVEIYKGDTQKTIDNYIENTAGQIAYNSVLDLHFEYAKWAKAKAIKDTSKGDIKGRLAGFSKVGLGQFAHYKFNMINLMNRWIREAGLSYRALDFTSQEAVRPLRFGILQASIWAATIGGRTNFVKLAPNDVIQTGDAMYTWLSSKRELLTEGSLSPETEEKLRRVTYGTGGWSFLGPNVQIVLGAYELLNHAEPSASKIKDPRTEFLYEDSIQKSVKRDDNQELYKKLAMINSQTARSVAYSLPQLRGGGSLADFGQLELGLYPSKSQKKLYKDWIPWAKKPKRRKKLISKSLSYEDRQAAIGALTGL